MTAGTALKTTPQYDSFDQRDGASLLQEDQNMPRKDQNVPRKDQKAPLHECVRSALRYYLENMDGHDVDGLYRMVLDEVERPLIETVLESANNNQTVAARMLGMSRGTLRKKLKALNLAP
jgi:Fis family transcriptional regulator